MLFRSLDEVEAAFYTPELNSNVSLRHLIGALWAVGIQERWPFELSLPRASKSLVWDGEDFRRRAVIKRAVKTTLVVSLLGQRQGGWLQPIMRRAELDAEILNTLKCWCYTCPVPLVVDGRRMDSLQACPGHGWGTRNHPMALGFAEAEVPDFPLSPGTFEKQPARTDEGRFRTDARKAMEGVSPRQVASVPFLLAYHFDPSHSLVYWVQDGVVVQTEPLSEEKLLTTVGCFVNAEGLQSDLTTLYLRDTPERNHRKDVVHRAVVAGLRDLTVLNQSMEELAQAAREKGSWNQKIFYLAGFGAFWVSPVAGLLLAGAAWLSGRSPDGEIKERSLKYNERVTELLALLELND